MVAFICLFIPAIIAEYVCERFFEKTEYGVLDRVRIYSFMLLCINTIMFLIVNTMDSGNMFLKMEEFSGFAFKYMVGASVLAIFIPFAIKKIKTIRSSDIEWKLGKTQFLDWFATIYIYIYMLQYLFF